MKIRPLRLLLPLLFSSSSWAQESDRSPSSGQEGSRLAAEEVPATVPQDPELNVGEFVVTGKTTTPLPKIAILPSTTLLHEDVVVRHVVRRDLELSGLYRVIDDSLAPEGNYSFQAPVDVQAFQKLGAEAIIKVAARAASDQKIEMLGLAYFPAIGPQPVYKTSLVIDKKLARVTAHRITDALLGALTGRPGGFASEFVFSHQSGRHQRIFRADADGYGVRAISPKKATSIAPFLRKNGQLFFSESLNYSPFYLMQLRGENEMGSEAPKLSLHDQALRAHQAPELNRRTQTLGEPSPVEPFPLPFPSSIYSASFSNDGKTIAIAVAENGGSGIFEGPAQGGALSDFRRVSTTGFATQPSYSAAGQLTWVGGGAKGVPPRIYVDGKPVSPATHSASAPTFCETEDGTFLVFSLALGDGHHDLFISQTNGGQLRRLTQGQGSNRYPACSPDGRLLAFFSNRSGKDALYVLSLKRGTTQRVMKHPGESLRWQALPPAKVDRADQNQEKQ
ncbi:MAG: hypothetical protein MK135_02590 [Polyangiaceae bacterium]|nr:hypothetical protein [Polyangiaceae bacterium]